MRKVTRGIIAAAVALALAGAPVLPSCILPGISVAVSAETANSGSCGENASWELDSDGTLTISGTGAVTSAAWDSYKKQYKVR